MNEETLKLYIDIKNSEIDKSVKVKCLLLLEVSNEQNILLVKSKIDEILTEYIDGLDKENELIEKDLKQIEDFKILTSLLQKNQNQSNNSQTLEVNNDIQKNVVEQTNNTLQNPQIGQNNEVDDIRSQLQQLTAQNIQNSAPV